MNVKENLGTTHREQNSYIRNLRRENTVTTVKKTENNKK